MQQKDVHVTGKCFGTAVVGPRGQVVIPVEARKELGIGAGSRLLVFGHFEGLGLIFIKVEAAEKLLDVLTNKLGEVARLIREGQSSKVGRKRSPKRS